jgi:hypothetical protein
MGWLWTMSRGFGKVFDLALAVMFLGIGCVGIFVGTQELFAMESASQWSVEQYFTFIFAAAAVIGLKQPWNGPIKDKGLAMANAAAIRFAQSFNKLAAEATNRIRSGQYLESAEKLGAELARRGRRLWKRMAP